MKKRLVQLAFNPFPMVLWVPETRVLGTYSTTYLIKVGYEYFYGFSVYLPSTWEFDGDNADILVQWKGFGGQPFISLQQKHDGLYLRTNSNPDPDFDPENSDELIKLQYLIVKNVELGRWHDFIFKVIWDFKTDGEGLLQVR